MSGVTRTAVAAVAVIAVLFSVLVAVYANEPFNIATVFGLAGIAVLVKLYRRHGASK
jgi:xanthine/uracil/vitamin C permease (AzgA family)